MFVAVDGILVDKNSIILIKRKNSPYKNYWALPGGRVEDIESVEEALIREMKEETNTKVTIQNILGVYSGPDRDPRGPSLSVVFICGYSGVPMAADDAEKLMIIPLQEAINLTLAFDHNQILENFKEWNSNIDKNKIQTYYSNYTILEDEKA